MTLVCIFFCAAKLCDYVNIGINARLCDSVNIGINARKGVSILLTHFWAFVMMMAFLFLSPHVFFTRQCFLIFPRLISMIIFPDAYSFASFFSFIMGFQKWWWRFFIFLLMFLHSMVLPHLPHLIFMVIFLDASSFTSTSLMHRIHVCVVENGQQKKLVSITDRRYQYHHLSIDTLFLVSIPCPKHRYLLPSVFELTPIPPSYVAIQKKNTNAASHSGGTQKIIFRKS